ncbi:hypothetical protein PIROE2DRAFT_58792 [Piromyces sp. E2]|nr:hypothetical protein PIROE2DRAFT_58792 [Piromyces sp. E2]|eukprot:OUM67404.1 hypothetical protein PIROE2DRAFT_58792 [Piromyces sp. E2]
MAYLPSYKNTSNISTTTSSHNKINKSKIPVHVNRINSVSDNEEGTEHHFISSKKHIQQKGHKFHKTHQNPEKDIEMEDVDNQVILQEEDDKEISNKDEFNEKAKNKIVLTSSKKIFESIKERPKISSDMINQKLNNLNKTDKEAVNKKTLLDTDTINFDSQNNIEIDTTSLFSNSTYSRVCKIKQSFEQNSLSRLSNNNFKRKDSLARIKERKQSIRIRRLSSPRKLSFNLYNGYNYNYIKKQPYRRYSDSFDLKKLPKISYHIKRTNSLHHPKIKDNINSNDDPEMVTARLSLSPTSSAKLSLPNNLSSILTHSFKAEPESITLPFNTLRASPEPDSIQMQVEPNDDSILEEDESIIEPNEDSIIEEEDMIENGNEINDYYEEDEVINDEDSIEQDQERNKDHKGDIESEEEDTIIENKENSKYEEESDEEYKENMDNEENNDDEEEEEEEEEENKNENVDYENQFENNSEEDDEKEKLGKIHNTNLFKAVKTGSNVKTEMYKDEKTKNNSDGFQDFDYPDPLVNMSFKKENQISNSHEHSEEYPSALAYIKQEYEDEDSMSKIKQEYEEEDSISKIKQEPNSMGMPTVKTETDFYSSDEYYANGTVKTEAIYPNINESLYNAEYYANDMINPKEIYSHDAIYSNNSYLNLNDMVETEEAYPQKTMYSSNKEYYPGEMNTHEALYPNEYYSNDPFTNVDHSNSHELMIQKKRNLSQTSFDYDLRKKRKENGNKSVLVLNPGTSTNLKPSH